MIRPATIEDAIAIAEIYNYYVKNTIVTFDIDPVSVQSITTKMKEGLLKYPWLVFEEEGKVLGFAYASEWRVKVAYRHTVETTIYLSETAGGKNIGTQLYSSLLLNLKTQNIHTAIGVLSVPNVGSEALHKKLGFQKAAHFKELGFKFDQWIDVSYWQLML